MASGSTGTTGLAKANHIQDYLLKQYKVFYDGCKVTSRVFQIFGTGEQLTSPKALVQKSDCFVVCVAGERSESQDPSQPQASTGIQHAI